VSYLSIDIFPLPRYSGSEAFSRKKAIMSVGNYFTMSGCYL